MAVVAETGVDGVVAIGGGSTTGLGKAIALRTDLPQIVVPTTYAGSEMTPILGETEDDAKTTQSSPKVLPEVVIYDVDLTMTLPAGLSGTSGINAIAHAVEALYARDAQSDHRPDGASKRSRALARALPPWSRRPADREARSRCLYGAWLCGMCLGAVGMALHHKLCHTLGGTSICRTPRRIPPSCRTRSPTTRRPFRGHGDLARIAAAIGAADAASSTSPARSAPNARCASSACRRRHRHAPAERARQPLLEPAPARAEPRCAP